MNPTSPSLRILLAADPMLPVPPLHYGGIERIVDALVRTYAQQGHTVGLIAHHASQSPAAQRFAWPAGNVHSKLDTLRNALALRRAVRVFRPDVVHSFARLAYLLPVLSTRLPKVMSYQRHTGGRQIAWAARLGGRSLRFTGCSEFIAAMGRRTAGDWIAVPNFVEPEKIAFAPHVAPDAPLVFLSRVETIKGPDLAIAIARAAKRRLLIAGNHATSGHEREFWDHAIAPHIGHEGIEYVGEVDDRQKSALLAQAAALVVPIQWDEPFGIVFAEALAAGTPVITCARGAAPEIISAGQTGFFIKTVADGIEAVNHLAQIDRTTCRRIAEERFSATACAQRYIECYRDLIAARDANPRLRRA